MLTNKPIWLESTPEQKSILIALLTMANYNDNPNPQKFKSGEPIPCGTLITTIEKIQRQCGKGVSIQNIRTALVKFEKMEFLTDKLTGKKRFITIINWGDYQDNPRLANRMTNSINDETNSIFNNKTNSNNFDEEPF